MIGLALLALLVGQDTVPDLSPRVRGMLDGFRLPPSGQPSIVTRFSGDSAWVGEQVELVTAAWFPRDVRERLRTQPTVRPPSPSGLWSVQSQSPPRLVLTRRAGPDVFDLYVVHQTLFPLGAQRIESPPAELTYLLPTSPSFFAPEDRKQLFSRVARLVVRPIPRPLLRELGSGPTARDMRVAWTTPAGGLRAGVPAEVELVVAGQGNTPLWPAPEIAWPAGVRVYPERTEERLWTVDGWRGGEKRFRFTLVVDSAGVLTLPRVRYPYFDPRTVSVVVAAATAFTLPVLAGTGAAADRKPPPVSAGEGIPLASRVVATAWPVLLLLAATPLLAGALRRRRRRPLLPDAPVAEAETQLRHLLGAPGEAGPERVATALRRRGVPRDDADQIRRWLVASARRRYGAASTDAVPAPPPVLERVLARLRAGVVPFLLLMLGAAGGALPAQQADGVARYRDGDLIGAARRFAAEAEATPLAMHAWRNLAAARWLGGDDVGAAAAWLAALDLAPRDRLTRAAFRDASTIPADVRRLAPTVPVSRDEALLLALVAWIAGGVAWRTRRRLAWTLLLVAALAGGLAARRTAERAGVRVLVRATTPLRVSPHPAAPVLGEAGAWSEARVDRMLDRWVLVTEDRGRRGWLPVTAVAPLGPLD